MANATKLPLTTEIAFYQFSRPDAPAPKLASPLNDYSDTEVQFSTPLLDENGDVVTRAFLLGIRRSNGSVETCYCAAGSLSADGLTATVIRGIDPGGLDYTTGSADFASEHDQDEAVFCNIPAQIPTMIFAALQGAIATGSSSFIIGTDATGTTTIKRSTGVGTSVGFIRWSNSNSKAEYSNDGSTWIAFDDTVASVLTKVSSNDTSPGYLSNKLAAGTGITLTVLTPGGDEDLEIKARGTLAQVISDVTSTSTAIDAAVTNYNALSAITLPTGFYPGGGRVTLGTLGDAVSASDITNNLNLVYQNTSDLKWYKVTSTTSTWYKRLGLVTESGIVGASVRVLLEGEYRNQNFSNINPTFTSSGTGSDFQLGSTAALAAASYLIDNSNGAECITTGGTISAKQNGTPAGPLLLYLVLDQRAEQTGYPACFVDTTNNVIRGAIIASASIAQALFSGTYQNLAFSWGANVKIPAGARVHLVVKKTGAADVTNYYFLQSAATPARIDSGTQTWSTAENTGNFTLTMTSTSPVGYAVKGYNGTNGGYSLTPSNPWARNIGQVLTTTSFYFNPDRKLSNLDYTSVSLSPTTLGGITTVTTDFCPSQIRVAALSYMDATTDVVRHLKGVVRGDNGYATSFQAKGNTEGGSVPDDFVGAAYTGTFPATPTAIELGVNQVTNQNKMYFQRLESGYYLYIGYPSGANFLSAGAAGYTRSVISYELESSI